MPYGQIITHKKALPKPIKALVGLINSIAITLDFVFIIRISKGGLPNHHYFIPFYDDFTKKITRLNAYF